MDNIKTILIYVKNIYCKKNQEQNNIIQFLISKKQTENKKT